MALQLARPFHTHADGRARLAQPVVGQLAACLAIGDGSPRSDEVILDPRHFDVDVDLPEREAAKRLERSSRLRTAVQQRT